MSRTFRVAFVSLIALSFLVSGLIVLSVLPTLRIAAPAAAAIARAWVAGTTSAPPADGHHVLPGLPDVELCGSSHNGSWSGFSNSDDGFSWGVSEHDGDGGVFSNSGRLSDALQDAIDHATGPILWCSDEGRDYVVRDPELVRRAEEASKPVREIGRQMGEIGREMGRLGREQGEWGRRFGELGGRLGRLEAQSAVARINGDDRADLEREIAEVRADMERLRAEKTTSGVRSDQFEQRDKMRDLSRRERDAVREARVKVRQILDDARRSGKLERLPGEGQI